MGADQSRPSGDGPSSGASSTTPAAGPDDFYTLLEVDDGAGELEIKVRRADTRPLLLRFELLPNCRSSC